MVQLPGPLIRSSYLTKNFDHKSKSKYRFVPFLFFFLLMNCLSHSLCLFSTSVFSEINLSRLISHPYYHLTNFLASSISTALSLCLFVCLSLSHITLSVCSSLPSSLYIYHPLILFISFLILSHLSHYLHSLTSFFRSLSRNLIHDTF